MGRRARLRGWITTPRNLALVIAATVGISVAFLRHRDYWTALAYTLPPGAIGGGGRCYLPAPNIPLFNAGALTPCSWGPLFDLPHTLLYLVEGVVVAAVAFLATAALRIAWRSFNPPKA